MLGDNGSDCHHDVIIIDGKYNVDHGYTSKQQKCLQFTRS